MTRMCRGVLIGFAVGYALALGLLTIGTFGLFGQEKDPLAGVFLLPLGLPWVYLLGPTEGSPWIGIAAPGLNLALLWALCLAFARHRRQRDRG